MHITLSGQHLEVTPPLRHYAEEKLTKLQRFSENPFRTQVTFKLEKLLQRVDATIHLSGAELHATATHDSMYAAIDLLVDKLARQLSKYKDRQLHHG